jgi:hypothetical protein
MYSLDLNNPQHLGFTHETLIKKCPTANRENVDVKRLVLVGSGGGPL